MTQTPAPGGTALLTIPEAGVELRVSRATVYRLIENGALTPVYTGPGGRARIERTDLDRYIVASRQKPARDIKAS